MEAVGHHLTRAHDRGCRERSGARPLRHVAVRATLLAVAIATAASGCGSSTRNRRAEMLMAEQRDQLVAAKASAGGAGNGGSAEPGAVGVAAAVPSSRDATIDAATYRLAPGDLLDVKFTYHPEENERVPVRPDGRINLQVAGDVNAAGLTVGELEKVVVERASRTLRGPVVSIVIAGFAEHKVYVTGQVAKPGFVVFRHGMTPLEAIVERGGFADDAKTDQVVHMRRVGGQVEAQKIDLSGVVAGTAAEEATLSPNDIVIVPRTFIGKADVFVDQWIRGLLPTIPRPGIDIPAFFF